jgi:hypothetical protein
MADNVSIKDASNATVVVAADEVVDGTLGTVEVQYAKLMDGTLGSTNKAVINSTGALSTAVNDQTGSGSLATGNAAVTMTLNGDSSVYVQCTGTHTGTQVFEGTIDGTNWFAINGVVPATGVIVTSFTANGQWVCDCAALTQFRVRRSVSSSGTAVITTRSSSAKGLVGLDQPLPAGSSVIGAVTQSGAWTDTVSGTVAVGATTASQPVRIGGTVATTNPTAQADTAVQYALMDKMGRLVVVQGHVRNLVAKQATTLTSTVAATTVVTAGGASVFTDITSITVTNSSATATNVTLTDGTTAFIYYLPGAGGFVSNFNPPLIGTTANTAWTLQCSVSVASVYCNIVYVKNL